MLPELLQEIHFYNVYAPFISYLFKGKTDEERISLFKLFQKLKELSVLSFELSDDPGDEYEFWYKRKRLIINDKSYPLTELYIDSNESVIKFIDYIDYKNEVELI